MIPFNNGVANANYFQITITFDDNSSVTHVFANNEEISKLQEGRVFYLSEKEFK